MNKKFKWDDIHERFTAMLEDHFRNCTECANWNDKKDICQKYNVKPPTKILVKGCEEFELIPF